LYHWSSWDNTTIYTISPPFVAATHSRKTNSKSFSHPYPRDQEEHNLLSYEPAFFSPTIDKSAAINGSFQLHLLQTLLLFSTHGSENQAKLTFALLSLLEINLSFLSLPPHLMKLRQEIFIL
jgi:hypothetical protein